jgi:Ubiquitin-2 like Rad60 SUMO-like
MQKVFDTYAQRKGIQSSSLRFLLDGEKIDSEATPKMLELDDQDQIDCMLEQVRLRRAVLWTGSGEVRLAVHPFAFNFFWCLLHFAPSFYYTCGREMLSLVCLFGIGCACNLRSRCVV